MVTENKKCKLAFQIFSLACFIAIGVCLIVDFAVNKTTVWSGYPVISVLLAWVVVLPLLMAKKNRALFSIAGFTVAVLPFLYLLERLTPAKGWYMPLGVPIAIVTVIAVWLTYCLLRVIKINVWYFAAAMVLLYGVIGTNAVKFFVSRFLNASMWTLDNIINLFACVVIIALAAIIGHSKGQNKKLKDENERLQ